jgi:hypothetical protein
VRFKERTLSVKDQVQVVFTTRAIRGLANFLDSGQQQSDQDRYDGDYDE